MATSEQKRKLLKAKIAVALRDELGRVPKTEEWNKFSCCPRLCTKLCEVSTISASSKPVVRGTRIPVEHVLGRLAENPDLEVQRCVVDGYAPLNDLAGEVPPPLPNRCPLACSGDFCNDACPPT